MKRNLLIYFFFLLVFSSCENIFAPKLDNSTSAPIISDQTTVDGVFKNFKYAYTFKDTSVYSNLFTDDFIFTYRDYALGYDVSWDKPTELRTTNGLFQNSQKLEIIWNNIILQVGDSLHQTLKRSFNLTITFNPSNIIRLNGFADMSLIKNTTDNRWRIYKWKDESF
ncbi:MAG: hypothetical protein HY959_07485 [Ignavibacteriae bacterium]|nr:hypothetical protein [Ignavibacteriota bacterium]